MNTGDPWPDRYEAELRVHEMQTKLHCWAMTDAGRCFDHLFNLVCDPAFLVVAWNRVRGNRGPQTAGVDGVKPRSVTGSDQAVLSGLREHLKARRFVPARVREKAIPKAGGKVRKLGIPTAADRVVQASLKLVLEPIFVAGFKPCSYGFRPKRRAQDAIAEIDYLGTPTRNYEWVFEADITACLDEIDHVALMGWVRDRIGDKRVLALVKAFDGLIWPVTRISSLTADAEQVRTSKNGDASWSISSSGWRGGETGPGVVADCARVVSQR